jgi:hypothetical protein
MAKAMAPDPAIGIWRLNLSKSSLRLVPTPSVMKIESCEDGLKVSADIIDPQGNKLQPAIVYKFDGQDYPLVGSPIADTISAKRITNRIGETIWKKDGRVVVTMRMGVSVDGQTLNVIRTSTDAEGRPIDDVMVYDKE